PLRRPHPHRRGLQGQLRSGPLHPRGRQEQARVPQAAGAGAARAAERQSRSPAGRASALSAGEGAGRRGAAAARPCDRARAVRRHRHPGRFAPARHLPRIGHRGADQYRGRRAGGDRPRVGRRQPEGDRPHPREAGRPRRDLRRLLSGPRVVRHGCKHQSRNRIGVLDPAGAKRERQLGEGGAARSRAHPRRPQARRSRFARRHERRRRHRHRSPPLPRRAVLMSSLALGDRAATPHRGIVSVCSMIATLMQALDNTIANVALPYMQGSLSTTLDQITWVLTSYVVAAAIMTAPVCSLASRFPPHNFFLACVGGFTVASMLCGIAESLAQMVVFRLLQGMFGAALVPLSQATMLDLYPIQQRGSAMAWWGMGVMVGPILGPTLGGYLTDMYDWRWVFYINLPFGLLAMAGLWLFMQDAGQNAKLRFDWTGFLVLSMCLGAFQLMLDRGEQLDWFHSTEIVVELILAVLGLYLFLVHMFT